MGILRETVYGMVLGAFNAPGGVMGLIGFEFVAKEERERREKGRRGGGWTRIGRRRSAERSARDVDGGLRDMVKVGEGMILFRFYEFEDTGG